MAIRQNTEVQLDTKSLVFSGLLHVSVVAVAIFGVPQLWMKPPEPAEPVVLVDLAPIREISNAPPPAPKTVEAKPEPPKEQPKQQPARVEAPPPPPPPPPQAEPEPSATPLPKAKPEPPKPEPAPQQAALDVPKPRVKPEPPKPIQQPTPPLEKSKADFDPTRIAALINKVQKPSAQVTPPTPAKTTATEAPAVKAQGPSNPNLPVSQSDKDFIRAQVERHWAFDIGAKGAQDLVIRISVSFNADGTLKKQPEVVDQARMFLPGQEAYRSAAEAARRAVLKAVPIRLPPGDAERWAQEIVLVFNPRDMLGG